MFSLASPHDPPIISNLYFKINDHMSQPSLLHKILAALQKYRLLLKEHGLSNSEITYQLASLTPHRQPIIQPNSRMVILKPDFANPALAANQVQESLSQLINSFLHSYSSLSQALTQLLAEVEYQTAMLSQNSEEKNTREVLVQQATSQSTEKAPSKNSDGISKQERQRKDKKKKNIGKNNTSRGRAIEQLQMEAQADDTQFSNKRTDPNLAQIKALQQYLELKLLEGSLAMNPFIFFNKELEGLDNGRIDSSQPMIVFNL